MRVAVLFRVALVLMVSVYVMAGSPVCAEITAEEILSRLRVLQDSLENLTVTSRWEEYAQGNLIASSEETIAKDGFGRIRVRSIVGPPGASHIVSDRTYNGEFLVTFRDDPNRNRMGAEHTDQTRKDGERHRTAIISEGLGADGVGPNRHRNPFHFTIGWVIDTLDALQHSGGDVAVESVEGEQEAYVVRFRAPEDRDPSGNLHSVFIDPAKEWVITRHEVHDSSGALRSLETFEYAADSGGIWLPKSGSSKNWGTSGPDQEPAREWRFEVKEIRYNDPEFDDSVFEVSLPPGTYVTDNRYRVSYWVGEASAVTRDLAELAQQAAAEQAATLRRLDEPRGVPVDIAEGTGESWLSLRSALVLLNIVVLVALLGVWYWRSHA